MRTSECGNKKTREKHVNTRFRLDLRRNESSIVLSIFCSFVFVLVLAVENAVANKFQFPIGNTVRRVSISGKG